ncbi:Uncharacterised protein [Mycobacteroides abscessus subsp. abscessus]|nr:Uncharacterised protein [Mycobacteroides abscessus subsp. abscessus]
MVFSMASASPVSSDSSISRADSSMTSPSTTIWSPGPSSMMSSSTTSLGASAVATPSRRTKGRVWPTMASLSSVCLARSS